MVALYDLAEGIRRCTACPLWKGRMLAVPGEGPKNARVMFVGEAPGVVEDRQGIPFVGRSGIFLDKMLEKARILREDVFITGAVKCRPPGNRVPQSLELQTCKRLWLNQQLELIRPKLVVVLGRTAMKSLLGKNDLKKRHGEVLKRDGLLFFITFHPAAGMRFPTVNRLMEQDFKKLGQILKRKK